MEGVDEIISTTKVQEGNPGAVWVLREIPARGDRDVTNQVPGGGRGQSGGADPQLVEVFIQADQTLLATVKAQVFGESTGIDLANSDNALIHEVAMEGLFCAVIAGKGAHVVDDETTSSDAGGFPVFFVDTVVAYKGIGHNNNLTGIRGIG